VLGKPVELTISGGVASYPEDARTPEALLECAARALYVAKASGKNMIEVYQPERRRFLRFDLTPSRYEVEVITARGASPGRLRNLSRNGIVFASPEILEVGEEIEIRLAAPTEDTAPGARLRGRVVRLEELPEPTSDGRSDDPAAAADDEDLGDRFEIGMVVEADDADGRRGLMDFLESANAGSPESRR
jgi:hypothetical protein